MSGSATEQPGLFDEAALTTAPAKPPARCRPGIQWWYVSRHTEGTTRRGHLRYQGLCRPCNWDGEERASENQAVEDAMDHAWPGWRDQPVMPGVPREQPALSRWLAQARRIYPAGWVDGGGPVRTRRGPGLTRHHDSTEWGGYDIAAGAVA